MNQVSIYIVCVSTSLLTHTHTLSQTTKRSKHNGVTTPLVQAVTPLVQTVCYVHGEAVVVVIIVVQFDDN